MSEVFTFQEGYLVERFLFLAGISILPEKWLIWLILKEESLLVELKRKVVKDLKNHYLLQRLK